MKAQSKGLTADGPTAERGGRRGDAILAVGLLKEDRHDLPSMLFGALGRSAAVAGFADLTRDRLWSVMVVLSPLITLEFDAVEMAAHLDELDFHGRYYAYGGAVPNADLIRQEVAAVAPDISFEIITINDVLSVVPSEPVRA